MQDGKLPLGIMKQAVMKLDSAGVDIREALEDEDLNDGQREILMQISEMLPSMMSAILNIIVDEIDEEEFSNEEVEMDMIDDYPEKEFDLMDQKI